MNSQKNPRVCIGILVYNKKGEILLVRSHKWRNKWVCVGGGLERGERLGECARREAKEETGLTVSNIRFVEMQEAVFPKQYHKKQHFIFIDFCAKAGDKKVRLNEEAEEYKWVSLRTALRMNLGPPTRLFIKRYMEKLKKEKANR